MIILDKQNFRCYNPNKKHPFLIGGNTMAPKFKFTKEEILEVTLDFIRINGIKEISARTIARELNASTKVIFSLFGSMENLIREVNQLARNEFLYKVKIF